MDVPIMVTAFPLACPRAEGLTLPRASAVLLRGRPGHHRHACHAGVGLQVICPHSRLPCGVGGGHRAAAGTAGAPPVHVQGTRLPCMGTFPGCPAQR